MCYFFTSCDNFSLYKNFIEKMRYLKRWVTNMSKVVDDIWTKRNSWLWYNKMSGALEIFAVQKGCVADKKVAI